MSCSTQSRAPARITSPRCARYPSTPLAPRLQRPIVLGDPSPQQPDLETLFHSWSDRVHLYRTVSTDDAVVRQLLKELAYRGISDLGQIALVVERDTLYARQHGRVFRRLSLLKGQRLRSANLLHLSARARWPRAAGCGR